jgi:chromate reductase, NAD(P)H dehydrogenase (quinone)
MEVPAHQRFKLLGLSGSLRKAANSTAILRTLRDGLTPDVEMEIVPLDDIPPFNEDNDVGEGPASVPALRRAVRAADGIVIVSPEYNHGIPGHLKNAIDWASRPGYDGPLKNKPVKIITIASSPLGGARAQAWLQEVFSSTLSRVVPGKQVIIGAVEAKVKDGRLIHDDTLIFALNSIDEVLDEVCLVQGRPKRIVPDAWQRRKLDKPPR